MNWFSMAGVVVVGGVVGLAGCGDKPEPKAKTLVESAAPAATPAPLEPRYKATLAEGIDFKKQGYPDFLAEVWGMSGHEPWGRWTDAGAGPMAKFRFKQALPRKFTLEITADAFGPNKGAPVKVRVGSIEKTFVITSKKDADPYRLVFETDNNVDTLEITPPKPTSPNEINPQDGDTRKLGIGFVSLKIKS
jgi:phosphoglycerol transferase